MLKSNKSSIISNIHFYYAKLDKPTINRFGNEVYDLQLRFPKERIQEMSAYGKVRQVEDGNFAINITRKAVNSNGKKTPVKVVDHNKQPIKDLIGNGSFGNVIAYTYDYNVGGKIGQKSIMTAVQVTELIKYIPQSEVDFDILEPVANKEETVSADF